MAVLAAPAPGAASGPVPIDPADYRPTDPAQVRLGWLLFYDPVLSGNREVACATCHHPRHATGDGVALGIGDGGRGLGPERRADPENPPEQRIPRNATALFNLGHRDLRVLFHDGRIEEASAHKDGLRTPLEEDMRAGFSGIVSAQTMFPVLSQDEMAGHYQENEIAQAVRQGFITGSGGAWDLIAQRVAAIPAYAQGFAALDPAIGRDRALDFVDISDAIAAFMMAEWRADDSPYDRHLRAETPLSGPAAEGMALFFGPAGCGTCHSGPLLSDQGFHAMGMPQIGPGKVARFERHARDEGRYRVTGDPADLFAFRTPMLRNVVQTGPWGHSGAYADLRAFVTAHLDPPGAIAAYDRAEALLPDLPGVADWRILDDPPEAQAIAARARPGVTLDDAGIDAILAFLAALSDETSLTGRLGVPDRVPSGLPVP